MRQEWSRRVAFGVGVLVLSCGPVARAAESCNQIELPPDSEATVSVLLPDVADDLQPRLTVRTARESAPVDAWGPCPTAEPYGACSPAAHGDVRTVGARKIMDPGDGMRLIGFRLKNGGGGPRSDVRLCVRYGMN